ncbi:MAG TPA: hypothetical protein VK720_08370 [Terracidiphilus sp.]|jgi:hypothetical protein|nr:hypothetical protein [Terracidiphilus sp.]
MDTLPNTAFFPARPPGAMQLLAALKEIFPQFGQGDVVEDVKDADDTGLHCVMRHFTEYFGANHPQFSERQLTALARLLDEAVMVNDDLENAVATCMLEHLHQINGCRALSPYLSQKAKEQTKP